MKRKIEGYLSSKEKKQYNPLDKIFELYLDGDLKKLLSKYEGVGIYPKINKSLKNIQLSYNFYNICVNIDFYENKYIVAIYQSGISPEDLENLFVEYAYQEDFEFEKLIIKIDEQIIAHPQLYVTSSIDKKKKIYSLLATISLWAPITVIAIMGIYCGITDSAIQGNVWWGVFLIIIPLTLWFIFDAKSKRMK